MAPGEQFSGYERTGVAGGAVDRYWGGGHFNFLSFEYRTLVR
jgi:hypothetical protein